MVGEACPMPSDKSDGEAEVIGRLIAAKRIVVVGASNDPGRAGCYVPEYLLSVGKEVVPVNPKHRQVLGRKCYGSLAEVPGPIDLVDVFRRGEACPEVVREAIAVGAKGVWLQSGIVSEEARRLAREAGIDFVQDRCLMVEHRRGQAAL